MFDRNPNNDSRQRQALQLLLEQGGFGAWAEEQPAGAIDGANLAFTLSEFPAIGGLVLVHRNGLWLRAGATYDYTITGKVITFNAGEAPAAGADLRVLYQR
jgi:hypothetical protein